MVNKTAQNILSTSAPIIPLQNNTSFDIIDRNTFGQIHSSMFDAWSDRPRPRPTQLIIGTAVNLWSDDTFSPWSLES